MDQRGRRLSGFLIQGGLDIVLAGLMALLSVLLGLAADQPVAMLLDIAIYVCAGLVVRWPRAAGVLLGLLLIGYFVNPENATELGQYAPLLTVLGTGMRGERRVRAWMAVGYWAILAGLQIVDSEGSVLGFVGAIIWAALIAAFWLIGNAFAAYGRAQAELRDAALVQQRLALARDLHDTVARDLSRASLRAQVAQQSLDPAEMSAVVGEIQSALTQLRLTMTLLRDPEKELPQPSVQRAGSPGDVLREATASLEAAGFTVALTVEGELDAIPTEFWPTIRAVVGEAVSNIERHGSKTAPSALILNAEPAAVDMVFINSRSEVGVNSSSGASAMGLLGLRERLALIGGELNTLQEEKQWMTRVTIPFAVPVSSGS